jgi:hypothetical protein
VSVAHNSKTGEPTAAATNGANGSGWVTRGDGARVRAPEAPRAKRQRGKASGAASPRLAPGTWRYDTAPDGSRFRRPLTADEVATREASKSLAEERRIANRVLLESLLPAGRLPGEPPVTADRLFPLDARTSAGVEIASLARPNGSAVRLVSRYYDGQARTGRRPLAYVSAHVVFVQPTSHLPFRSTGVMFERGELRPVGAALLAEADRLDALEAAGELPEFLAPVTAPVVAKVAPIDAAGEGDSADASDCPDCGGERPVHLDGCDRWDGAPATPAPAAAENRTAPRAPVEVAPTIKAPIDEEAQDERDASSAAPVAIGQPAADAPRVMVVCASDVAAGALTEKLRTEGFKTQDFGGRIVFVQAESAAGAPGLADRFRREGLFAEVKA